MEPSWGAARCSRKLQYFTVGWSGGPETGALMEGGQVREVAPLSHVKRKGGPATGALAEGSDVQQVAPII